MFRACEAAKLATTLAERRDDAMLYRTLATLITDVKVGSVDDWKWNGPTDDFSAICDRIGAQHLLAAPNVCSHKRGSGSSQRAPEQARVVSYVSSHFLKIVLRYFWSQIGVG